MPISVVTTDLDKFLALLERGEGHFLEFKSKNSVPARLTKSLSAFANADGGELFIGVDDGSAPSRERWNGFNNVEEANGFIQAFGEFFPLGGYFRYEFLTTTKFGYVLHCEILKRLTLGKLAVARYISPTRSAEHSSGYRREIDSTQV
jgi:ATP-dependent DNA helicase RecG